MFRVTSRDELGRLGATFNQLAESLQRTIEEKDRVLAETNRLYRNLKVARARLGRAERLSAVGMLAAGVSHELNNPLGIILSTAGNLREAARRRAARSLKTWRSSKQRPSAAGASSRAC